MMMAQPFAAHSAGMPAHAGIPHNGHPMAPGHPSNQGTPGGGQPGVSMGQPMHAGLAGAPGGPPVSQAGSMMPGIPQGGGAPVVSGGGPSAHALSHLNPAHPQPMFTQQQQMHQPSKSSFLNIQMIAISGLNSVHGEIACSHGISNRAIEF